MSIDGKQLGVIQIPVQERFLYLKKDFGKLRANIVYYRRGSSTSILTPDEITRLGTTNPPSLDLRFADCAERILLARHSTITSTVLHPPAKIPDYGVAINFLEFNRNYYREFIRYALFDQLTKPIGLAITNTSSTTAHDVRITLTVPDKKRIVTIALDAPALPDQLHLEPKKRKPTKPLIEVHRATSAWHLSAHVIKIQPRATHYVRQQIQIGATATTHLDIAATLHADNLPEPITTNLTIDITSNERNVTLIEALKLYHLD